MSEKNTQGYCLKMVPCECDSGGSAPATLPNLSYDEQFAGFYDVDGSKVYVKTFDFGPLAKTKNVLHNIANLKNVIEIKSRWFNETGFFGTGYTSGYTYSFYVTLTDIAFKTNTSNSLAGNHATVTLYYTCTDR